MAQIFDEIKMRRRSWQLKNGNRTLLPLIEFLENGITPVNRYLIRENYDIAIFILEVQSFLVLGNGELFIGKRKMGINQALSF